MSYFNEKRHILMVLECSCRMMINSDICYKQNKHCLNPVPAHRYCVLLIQIIGKLHLLWILLIINSLELDMPLCVFCMYTAH